MILYAWTLFEGYFSELKRTLFKSQTHRKYMMQYFSYIYLMTERKHSKKYWAMLINIEYNKNYNKFLHFLPCWVRKTLLRIEREKGAQLCLRIILFSSRLFFFWTEVPFTLNGSRSWWHETFPLMFVCNWLWSGTWFSLPWLDRNWDLCWLTLIICQYDIFCSLIFRFRGIWVDLRLWVSSRHSNSFRL